MNESKPVSEATRDEVYRARLASEVAVAREAARLAEDAAARLFEAGVCHQTATTLRASALALRQFVRYYAPSGGAL